MTTPYPLPPLDPDLAAMLAFSRAFRHLEDERASSTHPSALMRDLLPAEMGAQLAHLTAVGNRDAVGGKQKEK